MKQQNDNNYLLNNNKIKTIKCLASATTNRKITAEREADEIVQVVIKTYKLFGSRKITDFINNTIVQPDNLDKDFKTFIKAHKIVLDTAMLKLSQGKTTTKTNTRRHIMYSKSTPGDSKHLILDPVLSEKYKVHHGTVTTLSSIHNVYKMRSRSST